jgi:hypothetical protein
VFTRTLEQHCTELAHIKMENAFYFFGSAKACTQGLMKSVPLDVGLDMGIFQRLLGDFMCSQA